MNVDILDGLGFILRCAAVIIFLSLVICVTVILSPLILIGLFYEAAKRK